MDTELSEYAASLHLDTSVREIDVLAQRLWAYWAERYGLVSIDYRWDQMGARVRNLWREIARIATSEK